MLVVKRRIDIFAAVGLIGTCVIASACGGGGVKDMVGTTSSLTVIATPALTLFDSSAECVQIVRPVIDEMIRIYETGNWVRVSEPLTAAIQANNDPMIFRALNSVAGILRPIVEGGAAEAEQNARNACAG